MARLGRATLPAIFSLLVFNWMEILEGLPDCALPRRPTGLWIT